MAIVRQRRGATAIQYAMVVGLIGVVAIVAVSAVGRVDSALLQSVANRLDNATASSIPAAPASPQGPSCSAGAQIVAKFTRGGTAYYLCKAPRSTPMPATALTAPIDQTGFALGDRITSYDGTVSYGAFNFEWQNMTAVSGPVANTTRETATCTTSPCNNASYANTANATSLAYVGNAILNPISLDGQNLNGQIAYYREFGGPDSYVHQWKYVFLGGVSAMPIGSPSNSYAYLRAYHGTTLYELNTAQEKTWVEPAP